jgi:fumarate reductase subunit C
MSNPLDSPPKLSKVPAGLDLTQSITGLILAIFMWIHLLLVSSILLGKDAMFYVSGFFELKFLTGWTHGYPVIVAVIAAGIFSLFIIHAGVALRKFPISWKQHRVFRHQMGMMKHADTNLWYWQSVTGFVMFFLGSVHLYIMLSRPDQIGPHLSADRYVSQSLWPLYLVLLFAVETHAAIGLYRLAVKWGPFDGKDPRKNRKRLKLVKNIITTAFLLIGVTTFAVYMKIGLENKDKPLQRYTPAGLTTATQDRGEGQ